MAQDDYYYEIQLTNKQLVFYFMAAAAMMILSFILGVAVGRGVDSSVTDPRGTKVVAEEHIVPEESPSTKPAPSAEDLSYAQRLESDKPDRSLEPAAPASKPAAGPAEKAGAAAPAKAAPTPEPKKPARTTAGSAKASPPAPAKPSPKPKAQAKAATPASSSFTIQVGAFKDKATADSVAARLKGKGFPAYVVSPEGTDGGLYNVRVGSYPVRPDAEKTEARLRDEEKFKPFIVKN